MSATPYRKTFYAKLGDDEVAVQQGLENWVTALEKQVAILKDFLKEVGVK